MKATIPLTLILTSSLVAQTGLPKGATPPPRDKSAGASTLNKLEQQFEKSLSGAVLDGTFTIIGRGADTKLHSEKYTITRVKKLQGDVWLFNARIQYGKRDVTVPIPLEVKWAGDTPVITLTDLPIPGVGTYTARVLIYRGQYAGTWSGGDHGGQMFGKIVPLKKRNKAK